MTRETLKTLGKESQIEGSFSGKEELEIADAFASRRSVDDVVDASCDEENTSEELLAGTEVSMGKPNEERRPRRCSRTRL